MSKKRIEFLILFSFFLFAAGLFPEIGHTATPQEAEGMSLLIITLDTMRADRIGAYGYEKARTPHIDSLADEGIVFSNCYSPVPLTLPAHCSLFTGAYPLGHRVRDNGTFYLSDSETTLAEMMKAQDYETYAVVSSYVLLAKFGLNQGFSSYDDSLNAGELLHNFYSEITADVVYSKFKHWFSSRPDQNFFAWIHFYDPHAPYSPPEEFRRGNGSFSDMYDGEVAFLDTYVGKIVEDLKNENRLDDTLIVIAGDHGEAFGEHEEYGHSVFCYEENLKVPLIFHNSRLFPEASNVEQRVCLIDILPTLLEMYGMKVPPSIQGQSFARMLEGKTEKGLRSFYIESMYGRESLGWAPLTGIIDGPYKYLALPEPELYDLENDSREIDNLYTKRKDLADSLDEKLKNFMLEYSSPLGSTRRQMSADDLRRLESLGYVSSSSSGPGERLDPKRGIRLQAGFNAVNTDIDKGRLDLAMAGLDKIASQNPDIDMPQHFELRAKVYELTPDPQAVIETWKEAVDIFPANVQFKITLAFKLSQAGREKEAEALSLEIVRTDDKASGGFILLGGIEEKRGNIDKALDYFDRALDLEPNNVQLKLSLARLLGQAGRHEDALQMCRQILDDRTVTADPQNAGLVSKIGILLTEMNRIDWALQILSSAISMDDSNEETWNYLGVAHYRKNNFAKAEEAYERALSLDPQFAAASNNLGALHLRKFLESKDPESMGLAIEAFDSAIEKNPQLASAYNGRASAFKFSDRPDEAVKDWKKALELQPDFVDVYFNLGITYLQLDNKEEALKILNQCKSKFYSRLPSSEKGRLDRLIAEAGR